MHISLSQSLNIVKGDVAHFMDFPRTYISYHPKEAYGRKSIFECVWGNTEYSQQQEIERQILKYFVTDLNYKLGDPIMLYFRCNWG